MESKRKRDRKEKKEDTNDGEKLKAKEQGKTVAKPVLKRRHGFVRLGGKSGRF